MKLYMPNIIFGFSVLFITAAIGGMYLGSTFNEQAIQNGIHNLQIQRFFLREGHSHGNFMCIYNILVGIVLANLTLSDKLKKISSYAAMAAIFLPIGLAWKGVLGGVEEPPPIAMIGILGIALSLIIIIYGSWKSREL